MGRIRPDIGNWSVTNFTVVFPASFVPLNPDDDDGESVRGARTEGPRPGRGGPTTLVWTGAGTSRREVSEPLSSSRRWVPSV